MNLRHLQQRRVALREHQRVRAKPFTLVLHMKGEPVNLSAIKPRRRVQHVLGVVPLSAGPITTELKAQISYEVSFGGLPTP